MHLIVYIPKLVGRILCAHIVGVVELRYESGAWKTLHVAIDKDNIGVAVLFV